MAAYMPSGFLFTFTVASYLSLAANAQQFVANTIISVGHLQFVKNGTVCKTDGKAVAE